MIKNRLQVRADKKARSKESDIIKRKMRNLEMEGQTDSEDYLEVG